MIIVDTNVVSEMMKAAPSPAVLRWMAGHPKSSLFTTTITVAEIFLGVALLPQGTRRRALAATADQAFNRGFPGRVLAFGWSAARAFADIVAVRRRAGRPIADADAQIAAIARSRGAEVATRDVDGFALCGVDVRNPFGTI
jgi:toxin FitB